MDEPTKSEVMIHLVYIKDTVDELKELWQDNADKVAAHETRIAIVEQKTPKQSTQWGALGGFVGGILSGLIGSKLG